MLPHLLAEEDVRRFLASTSRMLLPGGLLLIQLFEYERIISEGVHHLPLNFRAGEGQDEIVFLRLLGDMQGTPLNPGVSSDLVILARRQPDPLLPR